MKRSSCLRRMFSFMSLAGSELLTQPADGWAADEVEVEAWQVAQRHFVGGGQHDIGCGEHGSGRVLGRQPHHREVVDRIWRVGCVRIRSQRDADGGPGIVGRAEGHALGGVRRPRHSVTLRPVSGARTPKPSTAAYCQKFVLRIDEVFRVFVSGSLTAW